MLALSNYVGELKFGGLVECRNLAMLPVLDGAQTAPEPPYLLLEDAIKARLASVREADMATVPEITVENLADRPVLILGGEELAGARQNRIVNVTILVPARTKTVIPVSCVEAGRWRPVSAEFFPVAECAYPRLRSRATSSAVRSSRLRRGLRTDQHAIWDDVAEKLHRMSVHSPTSAIRGAYEARSRDLEEFAAALRWQEGQKGALFAIGGRPAGLDLFDHPATCQRMLPRLIRGYALDALEQELLDRILSSEEAGAEAAASRQADSGASENVGETLRAWIRDVAGAEVSTHEGVGLGVHVLIEGPAGSGAALWAEERYVHFCAFPPPVERSRRPDSTDFFERLSRTVPRSRRFWPRY